MDALRPLLLPLGALYGGVMDIRNALYDTGLLKGERLPCPVISIGNLTLGGTGKTPLVDHAAHWFERNGIRPLILSRGYGGHYRGVARVDESARDAAELYGDEPVLLARNNPKAMVYVARKRAKAAVKIYAREKPGVIILDDGFQHRGLARNLDIVVLDPTAGRWDLTMFPAGRARERLSNLGRAHLAVLTKVNLASKSSLEAARAAVPKDMPVAEVNYEISEFVSLDGKQKKSARELGRVLAVSGIGNPEGFKLTLKAAGVNDISVMTFRDHHPFAVYDFEKMKSEKTIRGADSIVVTEKDAVKIADRSFPAWIARLKLTFERGEEGLDESFRRLLN